MSFSIDLWNGFNLLKEKFTTIFNKAQILYNIFISFLNMEKEYSKNLDNLYNSNKDQIKEEFLLEKSFIELINNIKEQNDFHKKHIDFLMKYLANPLKEMINKKNSIFQYFSENAKNLENLNKDKNNIISKQEKYHNSCADLTNFFIANETSKLNASFISDQSNFAKRQKLIDKINQNKSEYISILFSSNIDLEQYNLRSNQILDDLENKYETTLDLLKWSLINYANNKIVLYDKVNNLYKTVLKNYFTNIDDKQELQNFIRKYVTKEFPVSKFEFIPYKLNTINIKLFKEEERKKNPNDCNKKINLIKKFFTDNKLVSNIDLKEQNNELTSSHSCAPNNISIISSSIKKLIGLDKDAIKKHPKTAKKGRNISQELNYTSINNINNRFNQKDRENQLKTNATYIGFFVDKLMIKKGETKRNEIDKFKNIFLINKNENSIYFDSFIKALNEYRAQGKYIICDLSYDILVEVFKFMLDNFTEYDNLLKNLLILSQTFCKMSQNSDKKIYIQKGIRNHKIFSSSKLWHRVINYTLGQYINNKDLTIKVDKEENDKKLYILAQNTLIAYLCDLKCFTDDENVFDEVKKFYCEIYKLDENEIDNNVQISHNEMNISITEIKS